MEHICRSVPGVPAKLQGIGLRLLKESLELCVRGGAKALGCEPSPRVGDADRSNARLWELGECHQPPAGQIGSIRRGQVPCRDGANPQASNGIE